MGQGKFIDIPGLIIAAVTLLGACGIFYGNTGEFGGSFAAAVMTAALVWCTYIIIKWLLLANRN